MPLVSTDKQEPYLEHLEEICKKLLSQSIFDTEKELAFCIWYLLVNAVKVKRDSRDGVTETIHSLGILEDVKLSLYQFKGAPLEDQAMFKRFNESSS